MAVVLQNSVSFCPVTRGFTLDVPLIRGDIILMIEVSQLNGKKYWVNPHMIESMETNPDLTLTMLSGKKIVVADRPEKIIEEIVSYRQRIGINTQEI